MSCPECKGTGWVELFTSREPCERCKRVAGGGIECESGSTRIKNCTVVGTSGGITIGPGGDYADFHLWMVDTNKDLIAAGECAGATVVTGQSDMCLNTRPVGSVFRGWVYRSLGR